ncbi:MAG: PCP reductase family protein [Proteobacteria bacterium]|nr:PCP reductase family protein [Pseudomonadota bacterium]
MKWNAEANEAISKVPFFVRKRVKKRVEEEAARCGSTGVRFGEILERTGLSHLFPSPLKGERAGEG